MKNLAAVLVLTFTVAVFAVAQSDPVAILEYYENDLEITVSDAEGFEYAIYLGMELVPGDTIETGASFAELRLDPNGTVVKIAPNTEFAVESLQGVDGAESNDFRLATGKFRAVAAQVSGARYNFRSRTSVGGVRGTELGMESIPGQKEALYVLEGLVTFTNTETGEALDLAAGQFADVFGQSFQAAAYNSEQITGFLENLEEFEAVTPPQPATEVAAAPEGEGEQEGESEEGVADDEADDDDDAAEADVTNVPPAPAATPPDPTDGPRQGGEADGPLSGLMSRVGDFLGMSAGSVTIGGQTYASVTISPELQLGKLGIGLYLPIVYNGNLFDPADWYKPAGNSEWSFGMDQDWQNEPLVAVQDFFTDLTLKIRYVTWGEQGQDDTYFKIGNLNDMTIGHGILMRNYANDVDFPAVRRVGLNLGLGTQTKPFGMEAMVNDIADPEIFGGRFVLRPGAPEFLAGLGLSGIADIAPASVLPSDEFPTVVAVDPVFINVAVDLDVPIITTNILGITAFGDVGGMLPYLRRGESAGLQSGLRTEALFDIDAGEIRNYGFMAGFLGNILMVDYRLEFRKFEGAFKPTFYSAPYDRIRGERAIELIEFLKDPNADRFQSSVMGVYGEASASLFDLVRVTAGYMWPWAVDPSGSLVYSDEDHLLAATEIAEGLIPFGITGRLSYERTHFVPTLLGKDGFENAKLFDANTVLSGEIVYPVSSGLKIAAGVTTTVLRDDNGNIMYEETGNGGAKRPKFGPSVSIETRIGF
jgi:hypothetical protein